MREQEVSKQTLVAILIATAAALIARSWLQVELRDGGMAQGTAADLSYLIVVPVLAVLLFSLWRGQKLFLAALYNSTHLTWRIAVRAIAVGLLLRLISWGELVVGVSFGFYQSHNPNAVVGPVFSLQCAAPELVILGVIVMAVMVPIIEEVTHRGYVMSFLRRRGLAVSIFISSLTFALFHPTSSWSFALGGGIVFGLQYWRTKSLWPSTISHAVVNGMIQIDWRCLYGQWNPRPKSLPLIVPGIAGIVVTAACIAGIYCLLLGTNHGALNAPRGGNTSK